MKLLIIEDSETLRRSLIVGLNHLGFATDDTGDGQEALSMALNNTYDVIILDLMLPGLSGLEILKALRKHKKQTRVLILSAKTETQDRVEGLLQGADDYLTKPFSFEELHARILTIMRRGSLEQVDQTLTVDEYRLNLVDKTFHFEQQTVDLTPNEFKILQCLFAAPNRVMSVEQISEAVVGHFDYVAKNTIEAHLSAIRKKVRDAGGTLPVKNKRGFGYVAQK
ncbi:response regulator transcription factor [Vibrio furnissii]|uniref:response regulator transcription factor n=1 Tax=Vibrio furnissii TaxID=29494 RepID=UPI001302661E|nr:response regulator transcription factor [Vibrio furnissii]MCG6233779.1 response regulator transcription factor [Vibrio furnissii]MCG6259871.1 response regulator transcription factor [Vibrio furnissii]